MAKPLNIRPQICSAELCQYKFELEHSKPIPIFKKINDADLRSVKGTESQDGLDLLSGMGRSRLINKRTLYGLYLYYGFDMVPSLVLNPSSSHTHMHL
jgi:hypothetical protein